MNVLDKDKDEEEEEEEDDNKFRMLNHIYKDNYEDDEDMSEYDRFRMLYCFMGIIMIGVVISMAFLCLYFNDGYIF